MIIISGFFSVMTGLIPVSASALVGFCPNSNIVLAILLCVGLSALANKFSKLLSANFFTKPLIA